MNFLNITKFFKKRSFLVIIGMLLLAFTVRIVYISQLKDNPFFNHPIVDSQEYHDMALKIAAGETPREDAFYQPPLYMYFLGLLYRLFGVDFFLIRLLQMVLGVINVWLTFLLARRFLGFYPAIACGLVLSLYGPMLFFEGELLAPVVIVFLNLTMLLLMVSFLEKPTRLRALLCGVLLGLSAITMSVILPFALVTCVYTYFYFRDKHKIHTKQDMIRKAEVTDKKKSKNNISVKPVKMPNLTGNNTPMAVKITITMGLLFVMGLAVVIFPVTWYNWKNSNDFVLISSNGGINFYLGTGRDFEKKVAIRPGYQWKELMQEPLDAGYKKPSQQSAYFMKKSFGIILQDPIGCVIGTIKKIYLFANGNEMMRNQEIYPFRHYSSLLSVLMWKHGVAFPFGILFPLAVLGAVLVLLLKERNLYLLILFIITHILVSVFFFISARYRMNIIPFLVILAVYGVNALFELWRGKNLKKISIAVALLLSIGVVSNWNVGPTPLNFNSDAYFNLGVVYMKQGLPEAKTMFQKAIEQDREFPDANGNLGIILDIEGDHIGAVKCFNVVLNKYPNDIEANSQLGIAYYNLGELEKARNQFIKVLSLEKDNEDAKYNLNIIERKLQQRENSGRVAR